MGRVMESNDMEYQTYADGAQLYAELSVSLSVRSARSVHLRSIVSESSAMSIL